MAKRCLDIGLGSLALILAAPAMLLTVLAIKLDSPGPVLFRQWRFGVGSQPILVLKFRTMRSHQNDLTGARRTLARDPRVTRVGRFLRRTSIDELPQLFNVLRGDMSLVGPRPHRCTCGRRQLLFEAVARYRARHVTRPGITGWAQVNGSRGAVDTLGKARRRVGRPLLPRALVVLARPADPGGNGLRRLPVPGRGLRVAAGGEGARRDWAKDSDRGAGESRHRTGKALFWTLLDVGGSQGLSFLLYVILTRILTPAEYGVFALALSITAIANIVAFQGFSDALIQRDMTEEDDRSTAFWTNLGLGALLGGAIFLTAPLFARVFDAPELGPVLQAMSSLCLLRAMISVHSALCRRGIAGAVFAVRAIGGYVAGGVVGILMALQGWGVWSLVASQIVQAVTVMIVMWVTVRWVPRLRFSYASFRELAAFSRHLIAASVLMSVADKVDTLVIAWCWMQPRSATTASPSRCCRRSAC